MRLESEVNIYDQNAILNRFKTNETALNIVQGHISAIVSETEFQELVSGKTTLASQFATLDLTVNQFKTEVSNTYVTTDTYNKEIQSIESWQTKLEQGDESITLGAYVTKDVYTQGINNTLINAKNYADAQIKVATDSIILGVSNTYVTNDTYNNGIANTLNSAKSYSDSGIQVFANSLKLYTETNGRKASITLKSDNANLASGTIEFSGLVLFTDLSTSGKTTIHGGNITTNTITADKLNVTDLYAIGATIGGWNINSSAIYKDYGNYRAYIQSPTANSTWVYSTQKKVSGGYTGTFYVRADGHMYCADAEIQGTFMADSGYIGKWQITKDGSLIADATTETVPGFLNRLYIHPITKKSEYVNGWAFSSQRFDIDSSGNISETGEAYWYITGGGDFYTEGTLYVDSMYTQYGTIVSTTGNLVIKASETGSGTGFIFDALNNAFRPARSGEYYVGTASAPWSSFFTIGSYNTVSDKKKKHDIQKLDENICVNLIKKIKTSSFIYNDSEYNRHHYGMIAQDVELTLTSLGISWQDCAIVDKTYNKDTKEYEYYLRYNEFIAPIIETEKYLLNKIEECDKENKKLIEKINNLEKEISEIRSLLKI